MASINPHTTRATGTILTAAIYNADHQNHITNASNLNSELITDTANIALLLPLLGKPTMQEFIAAGANVWNKPAGCKRIILDGGGGGAGGGGVAAGAAGTAASAGGGGSGVFAETAPLDVTSIASINFTIGAFGNGGAAGNNAGANGGDTIVIVGANTYTWAGGTGGSGGLATAAPVTIGPGGGVKGTSTNITGGGGYGETGFAASTPSFVAVGGAGGGSKFGLGGARSILTGTSIGVVNGASPVAPARCAGGAGACCCGTSGNGAGGNGVSGIMRVWEFY
jgi:hypothetical protein